MVHKIQNNGASAQKSIKHYGFAQIPRLVCRDGVMPNKPDERLTLAQRGLYAGLKDICGETGECFYTQRNLAEVMHTSIATLSRHIPELRDAGLISAEKKLRGTGPNKHEIYHIRMVNIWPANDARYKPVQTQEDTSVSNCNEEQGVPPNSVSNCNTSVSNCNNAQEGHAQDCFNLRDRRIRDSNNLTEEEDSSSSITFTSEEQWLWNLLAPQVKDTRKTTEKKQEQLDTLLRSVKTDQEVLDLCDDTRNGYLPDGKLWLQNLVNNVEDWDRRRQATKVKSAEERASRGEKTEIFSEMEAIVALKSQVLTRYNKRRIHYGGPIHEVYECSQQANIPYVEFERMARAAQAECQDIDAWIARMKEEIGTRAIAA